jgi:hypothetical protein
MNLLDLNNSGFSGFALAPSAHTSKKQPKTNIPKK